MKIRLLLLAILMAQSAGNNPQPGTKLSYAECVRIGSEIDIANENMQTINSRMASETSPSARQALQRELTAETEKIEKLKTQQSGGCRGVTVSSSDPRDQALTDTVRDSLGGGSLPGAPPPTPNAGDPSSACAPRLKTLQSLRANLPKIQLRISTLEAQLNAKIAPPSTADRATLQKDFAREKNDEQYTLTQISIIKETLVSLGCDPDTGKPDAKLKEFASKPPGTGSIANPEDENRPLCDRLPDDLRQIFDARSTTPDAQKASSGVAECHIEQGNPIYKNRGEYYGTRLSIFKDPSSQQAELRFLKLSRRFGGATVLFKAPVGDRGHIEGTYEYNIAVFQRGRYVVVVDNPEPPKDGMHVFIAEIARKLDELVSRW